ncbi:MAG: copper resistance protein CopC [Pseudomonadota bacterium]|nr:copper resistance protein CopC [Pseudomonadota bacterium]
MGIVKSGLSLLTAALILTMAAAWGHAIVVESQPVAGARLAQPPPRIVLRFNVRIEKSLVRATLSGPDGDRELPVTADGAADRLEMPLPPLPPGAYALRYKVLAADGHATEGILRFTVGGAAP